MDPYNLSSGAPAGPGVPTARNNTTATSSAPANFQVGRVDVPGTQADLNNNIQPQSHQHLAQQHHPVKHAQHQQPHQHEQYPPQGQLFSLPAATTSVAPDQETDPHQFQQSHQQSFFTQPDIPKTTNEGPTFEGAPTILPANTNSTGTGDPGLHVGGLGVPGAQVELLPAELETVEHASASRPPVGPFDPPAGPSGMAKVDTVSPLIHIQRENSMREHPTPPPAGQYNPGQTVAYDAQNPYHDGGSGNMTSSTTTTTATSTTPSAPAKVHIASAEAVAAANAANEADAQARGRRRSSLAVFADRFRSSSRSHSRSGEERSPSLSRRLSKTLSRTLDDEDSSPSGPYADVKQAQQDYIAKLRAEQEKNNITVNVDGLPIPQPQQRRRSSVAHVLGLDKPLLSR